MTASQLRNSEVVRASFRFLLQPDLTFWGPWLVTFQLISSFDLGPVGQLFSIKVNLLQDCECVLFAAFVRVRTRVCVEGGISFSREP